MAAGEQCQNEPHQRMIPIGPEQREDHPVHDEIADKGEEEEYDDEHMHITHPAHGSAFLGSKPSKLFSVVLVYDRASVMGRSP
jgi:hypothetical protein